MNADEPADRDDPDAKWGTPGMNCYCCTGTSDYCEFCDSWVGKCWCWNDDEDEPSYADKVNTPLSSETIEALREALESGEHARFRQARKDDSKA